MLKGWLFLPLIVGLALGAGRARAQTAVYFPSEPAVIQGPAASTAQGTCAAPCSLHDVYFQSPSQAVYLEIYDLASAVTNSTVISMGPTGNLKDWFGPFTAYDYNLAGLPPEQFANGISVALSTTPPTAGGSPTLSATGFIHVMSK